MCKEEVCKGIMSAFEMKTAVQLGLKNGTPCGLWPWM